MGTFGKSFTREMGKNTGKVVSNVLFGDWHSTPYRRVGATQYREPRKTQAELRHEQRMEQIEAEERLRLTQIQEQNKMKQKEQLLLIDTAVLQNIDNGTQQNDDEKNEGREDSLGRIISRRTVSDREKLNSTNYEELDILISKYKGQKLTNEQVAEVVSVACFVSNNQKIFLKENLKITDDLKEICNQYKSGGTAKEGRGILDEYYTDDKIVNAARNLVKDQLQNKIEISVLEPSVGTGNFLYATKDLALKSIITAFEINETTAKIAKILHPESEIYLRSFETEFIDEKGNKKDEIS